MRLDGKIATSSGNSKWISGEASRRRVHELRGCMDAIVIGSGTARADDPLLTVRPPGPRTPARIVLDSRGRLPSGSRLVRTAREVPLIVATASELPQERSLELRALGADVLPLQAEAGRPILAALLDELGRRRMTNILVEGGAEVLGSFLDARAIDEIHVAIAPRLVGGGGARTAIGGGLARIPGVGMDDPAVEGTRTLVRVETVQQEVSRVEVDAKAAGVEAVEERAQDRSGLESCL